MTRPLGTADFFALEAGDTLARLEQLVTRATPEAPPADEMVRAVRVLRGSALMAHQQPIARAAAALEAVARALRDGTRTWDVALREQIAQAIEEFRQLIRRTAEWGEAETTRAARLAFELERVAGGRPAPPPAAVAPAVAGEEGLNTGVRAFIAREGALIAGALDRAARAVAAAPDAREPLYTVLRRMQSLRGLAELAELAPLPEILDGLELAVGDLTRVYAPPPGAAEVLDAGAQALTRVSRDVAEHGRPVADAPEARRFTELLLQAFAVEADVVPIESLYADGDAAPVTRAATGPVFSPPVALTTLELVSHGEHLDQVAALLESAESLTERDLRLYALVAALRALGAASATPLGAALAGFAATTRAWIGSGQAAADLSGFSATLRDGGRLLRAAADAKDPARVVDGLTDLTTRLRGAAPAATAADTADAAVPIQALAYAGEPMIVDWGTPPEERPEEGEIVAIESLAPDDAPARVDDDAVVPIEWLAPDETASAEPAPETPGPLEASFRSYARLLEERGLGAASLDALVGRTAPVAVATPAELVVDVADLLYRGRRALERAATVRDALAVHLASPDDLEVARPLMLELLDLVPLALEDAR